MTNQAAWPSAVNARPLPASFARYSAWSARSKNEIESSSGFSSATPAEMCSRPACPIGRPEIALCSRPDEHQPTHEERRSLASTSVQDEPAPGLAS